MAVVVQAAMSLDGFIAGPGDAMDWVFEYTAPDEIPEIVPATGAMLSGRRLDRGLVDEVVVMVLPVLLGAGMHFHTSAAAARVELDLLSSARSGSVTLFKFRVRNRATGDHRCAS